MSTDVLLMSVADENLTKFTFLVHRSRRTLIDFHILLFTPHFIHQTKHAREKQTESR